MSEKEEQRFRQILWTVLLGIVSLLAFGYYHLPFSGNGEYTSPSIHTTCHRGMLSPCGVNLFACDDGNKYPCLRDAEILK